MTEICFVFLVGAWDCIMFLIRVLKLVELGARLHVLFGELGRGCTHFDAVSLADEQLLELLCDLVLCEAARLSVLVDHGATSHPSLSRKSRASGGRHADDTARHVQVARLLHRLGIPARNEDGIGEDFWQAQLQKANKIWILTCTYTCLTMHTWIDNQS